MARHTSLNPDYVINGSFGELYGYDFESKTERVKFLGEVQRVEGKITKSKKELNLSGTREKHYKLMDVGGEGTIHRFKVNSDFLRLVANVFWTADGQNAGEGTGDNQLTIGNITNSNAKRAFYNLGANPYHNIDFRTDLMLQLDDPESMGVEQIILKGVRFWDIPIGWQVNESVEEDITITFQKIQPIYLITGDSFADTYAARYNIQRNL
jgi:hypothetical protein